MTVCGFYLLTLLAVLGYQMINAASTPSPKQEYGDACSSSVQCDDASNTISCNYLVSKCLCVDGTYRNGQACVQYSTLSPSFGTTTTGTSYVYVQWSDQPASNYNDVYRLTISPDGTVRTATGKFYNFTNLQQGTNYIVSLVRTISRHGRTQSLPAVTTTTRTRVGYNQTCVAPDTCIDTHTSCRGGKCRCDVRFYWDTNCVSIDGLKPTAVTVSVNSPTTMTASWVSPDNAVVIGYEVTVMPDDTNQITVGRDIRTTPITGLTPGRQYTVSVKTKITYLQGRDEKTIPFSAQPKVTTPDTVGWLGDKTNLTAPDIFIDFLRADGDVGYYLVQLQGITDGVYLQSMPVAPPATNTTFNGVVPNYQYTLTITTHSNQQQSIPYTRTIRVRASPAGRVTNLKSFNKTSRSVAVEWSRPRQPNGDIYEYIVYVWTDLRCVRRVIINCTECSRNTTMPQMLMECTTNVTVVISQADIENVSHVIQHNITGLNPDTPYSIGVVAVNQEGPGMSSQVNVLLPEEAAGEPKNFTARSRSSSEITLTWDPPQPRPGVTQYNVTVYEKQEQGDSYDTLKIIHFSDWATKTYTIGNLSSYWLYKFDIVAETLIGASNIVSGIPVRTMESEPTVSTNFQITKLPNVFNMVRVSWKCPKQKDGRNGGIVSANLKYFTTQPAAYVEPVRQNINLSVGGTDCMWDETVTVTTEFMYEFLVRLYNRRFAGAIVHASFYIQGGPPLQTAVTNSVKETTEKSETPSLLICPRCLHDRTNGQVNNTGLIVCRKDNCGHARNRRQATTVVDYDNMANWNEANAQDFDITYRATKKDWLDGNIRKSSLIFTLGNEDCSGNTKNSFCNGKLPTGETFIVFAFSCTNYGCTTSNRIEISTPAQVPVAVVVGGVVAVVVVMLVVIGIFIILRRKKAQRKRPNKNRDQVIANFRPELYHIYDEIPDARMVTVHSSRSHEGHVNYVSGQSSRDRYNTYDQLATYPNADSHEYRRINIETRFK